MLASSFLFVLFQLCCASPRCPSSWAWHAPWAAAPTTATSPCCASSSPLPPFPPPRRDAPSASPPPSGPSTPSDPSSRAHSRQIFSARPISRAVLPSTPSQTCSLGTFDRNHRRRSSCQCRSSPRIHRWKRWTRERTILTVLARVSSVMNPGARSWAGGTSSSPTYSYRPCSHS